jgi:hypothetical protein
MTDLSLPPAPPPPIEVGDSSLVDPWQRRFETLAVLLVVVVVTVIVAAFAIADAQLGSGNAFGAGLERPDGIGELVRLAGSSAGFATAGALLVSLLLVTLGPGDRITGTGTFVLRALVGIGLFASGLAVVSAILTATRADDLADGSMMVSEVVGQGLVERVSTAAPLLAAAIISGYVAWCAFSTLGEVAPAPLVPDDETPPRSDLGSAAEGGWGPPPRTDVG